MATDTEDVAHWIRRRFTEAPSGLYPTAIARHARNAYSQARQEGVIYGNKRKRRALTPQVLKAFPWIADDSAFGVAVANRGACVGPAILRPDGR